MHEKHVVPYKKTTVDNSDDKNDHDGTATRDANRFCSNSTYLPTHRDNGTTMVSISL